MNIDKVAGIFNKVGRIIGITIGAILVVLIVIRMFVKDPQYYKDAKAERKEFREKVDSIYDKMKKDSVRFANIEQGIIIFSDIISQSNQRQEATIKEIKNLRKYFNEKINNVDKYSVTDLDSFYRARYPHLYQ